MLPRLRRVAGGLFAALTLLFAVPSAEAAIITVDFSGTLSNVPSVLSGTFSNGQAFSGRYRFDTTAVGSPLSNPAWVRYTYLDFTLTIGALTLTATGAPGSNVINILDNVGGFDTYRLDATRFAGAPRVDTLYVVRTYLQFTSAGDAHGTSLPSGVPNLADYAFNRSIQVTFGPNQFSLADSVTLFGTVTSTRPGSVPEPATLALAAVGVTAVARRRRRN